MPVFIIENEWNNQLQLTQNESKWQVTDVTGLNPPSAAISTSIIPNFDGSRFNSSRLNDRNVVIYLVINGNVEANRMALNEIVMPKRYIKVYYQNKTKNVYIEGYVESFEYGVFSEKVAAQISIICPQPYWTDLNDNVTFLTPIVDLFEFPFSIPAEGIAFSEMLSEMKVSIKNSGTIQTGITALIESTNTVLNPSIINTTTGETMKVNVEISKNDLLTISTLRGNKSIVMSTGSEQENVINDLDQSSQWITLVPGNNIFTYAADYGLENMRVTIYNRNLYGGV